MNTILDIRSLSAGYKVPVLHDISLTLHAGEILVLLGRNGCGKTTLCRAVSGDARLFSGDIYLAGKDIRTLSMRERARLAASVSQQCAVPAGLRAADVVAMGGYAEGDILGRPGEHTAARMTLYKERFGISALWDKDCAALSAGQRQMVHLTRAAVQNTPRLLLDEPNSALDFDNTYLFFQRLTDLVREEKRGALLVLHDPALALRFADRILLMQEGRLCGEIRVKNDDEDAVRSSLQKIYPRIRLIRDTENGSYFCDRYPSDT